MKNFLDSFQEDENEKISELESKFRDFLVMVQPKLSNETEQNFLNTLENLKNVPFRLKNAQDLNEVLELFKLVSPSTKNLRY